MQKFNKLIEICIFALILKVRKFKNYTHNFKSDLTLDKKAKDILFDTYWTSAGWKSDENFKTESSEFAYAKEKGVMFDPLTITKSEILTRLQEIVEAIPLQKITDAFLSSMTNGRLDWRSALGSYANAKRLLMENNFDDAYYGRGANIDLNILNFERIKWGGIRHNNGVYNWLDLTLLNTENVTKPTEQDIQIFQEILNEIRNSEIGENIESMRDRLKEVFKSSVEERHIFTDILGSAEILKPFTYDRNEAEKHLWTFVLHWRGEDKYDKEIVRKYFGAYGIS